MGEDMTMGHAADCRTAMHDALADVVTLVDRLNSSDYARTGLKGFPSSIGAHVRHCCDHVEAVLVGIEHGIIHYDRRERGTAVELDRGAAIEAITSLQSRVGALSDGALLKDVSVNVLVGDSATEMDFSSSAGREILHVFHHTLHHLAHMSAQVSQMNVPIDARIGRAPATLAADEERQCAR